MRIIVYGAGGIGSIVGGHLWRTGHAVVLIGRSGHVTAIQCRGLKLATPDRTFVLSVPAVTSLDQIAFRSDDVVFLCMKGQNTEDALHNLRAAIRDVPIFCLQNGVRNEEIAAKYFSRVYGAMVRIGAEYLKAGEVVCRRDPPGWLILGRYPKGTDQACIEVAQTLRAGGFLVKVTPDVMPYKWGKLLANLGNAIEAITGERGEGAEIIEKAVRQEFIDLLKEAGIHWISQEEVSKEWLEVARPPRGILKTTTLSSTWQSLIRQQGSVETEFLNGEIVRLAKKLGRSAPINEILWQICEEMAASREKPGKYSLNQLCSRLGLENG
jgi:2-dehydropantoate 2-reductase